MKILRPLKIETLTDQQFRKLINRSAEQQTSVLKTVLPIINNVKKHGDTALIGYIKKFDRVSLKSSDLVLTKKDIFGQYTKLERSGKYKDLIWALRAAYNNIYSFHKTQIKPESGTSKLGRLNRPLQKVAVYVPHGTAVYPSTLLMGAAPASAAGVPEIIVATKCLPDKTVPPAIIIAAQISNVTKIVKAAGVQSIAALAYGTQTIDKVDKIIGPGNVYVNAAKMYLNGIGATTIDFPAGPSEVAIIADDTAIPEFVAWDMLSQAEHDINASSVLITTSPALASAVSDKIDMLVKSIIDNEKRTGSARQTGSIITRSLKKYGGILITKTLDDAIKFVNEYAPEHLQVIVKNSKQALPKITNAGSIFIGNYSPVAAGDYTTGPNHILPTAGAAKTYSGVSVDTFMKKPTYQQLTKHDLAKYVKIVEILSKYEGLATAHGTSVKIRLQ
jgi:histidinol dehydrogenase